MFATAVYGVLNHESRRLRLACAGHPPPLLFRSGATVAAASMVAEVEAFAGGQEAEDDLTLLVLGLS
jgi:serine phosphatase RsbU (regulator of sigma subunit)